MTKVLWAAVLIATAAPGQRIRVAAPAQVAVPQPAAPLGALVGQGNLVDQAADDPGVQVEMFENPNLDRYLRKAQSFLDRENYSSAIQVLQDVIEGRTIEVVAGPGESAVEPSAAKPQPSGNQVSGNQASGNQAAGNQASGGAGDPADPARSTSAEPPDARNSVFSQNGRLFRPVSRLCHELLARMPSIGVDLYRTAYEVRAEEMLQQANDDGSVASLEAVCNRYFITVPAGKAMILLADRLMNEGRYRAAVLVLRDLIEVYPAENRKLLGISEVWCRFKIALCLRLAGELDAAHAAVDQLATTYPEDSLRIQGALESVRDLPTSELFARDVMHVGGHVHDGAELAWLTPDTDSLVPLWQVRFRNPEPYKDPKPANSDRNAFFENGNASMMPYASRYGPATWVTIASDRGAPDAPPRALFLEHYRLRLADAASGIMLAEGDGVDEPPPARENQPRVRIAASDFALLRPICDDARDYVVLGHPRATANSIEALKASELVAYQRGTLHRVWSSSQWLDGDGGLRDVIFLAAPTVFGERLLLPSLRRSAYTLECLDRSTGRPLWNTPLHGGGTEFFKAPGCPVAVQGGIAFVATNAGCVAAVDAFAGDLRWIRRYERRDPRNGPIKRRSQTQEERMGYVQPYAQGDLPGFLPNDLIAQQGLLVVAPCDGDMLLCLDSASGEPVWWLDGTMRYGPYGKLRELIGTDGDNLFLLSDTHLVSIGLSGGLVRWARELPGGDTRKGSRGRGAIVGNVVLVPGDNEVLAFDTAGKAPMRRLALPAFDSSRDPLGGSFDITAEGPWLAIGFQGGVEMFSSRAGLLQLAARAKDPLRKAGDLIAAGDSAAAETVLTTALQGQSTAAAEREQLEDQLLDLVRERAITLAKNGDVDGGLRALDTIFGLMGSRTRFAWHLARVELCRDSGNLRAHEVEQQRLYDYMEGKG